MVLAAFQSAVYCDGILHKCTVLCQSLHHFTSENSLFPLVKGWEPWGNENGEERLEQRNSKPLLSSSSVHSPTVLSQRASTNSCTQLVDDKEVQICSCKNPSHITPDEYLHSPLENIHIAGIRVYHAVAQPPKQNTSVTRTCLREREALTAQACLRREKLQMML